MRAANGGQQCRGGGAGRDQEVEVGLVVQEAAAVDAVPMRANTACNGGGGEGQVVGRTTLISVT